MNRLPDSYPYLEPCLGCFEDALMALSERPGNPIFASNGDISLVRFLRAMARLAPHADVTICVHTLFDETACKLHDMLKKGEIRSASIYCSYIDPSQERVCGNYPDIRICDTGCYSGLIDFIGDTSDLMIGGFMPQNAAIGSLCLYTLFTEPNTRSAIRKTLERHYKRFKPISAL